MEIEVARHYPVYMRIVQDMTKYQTQLPNAHQASYTLSQFSFATSKEPHP